MATDKPRITVTLEPHVYHTIKTLARLQGASMSFLVADLLKDFQPVLERVGVTLQDAKSAPMRARKSMLAAAEKAVLDIEPHFAAAVDQLSLLGASIAVAAKKPPVASESASGSRASGGVRKRSTPVPVTTGVRSAGKRAKRVGKK